MKIIGKEMIWRWLNHLNDMRHICRGEGGAFGLLYGEAHDSLNIARQALSRDLNRKATNDEVRDFVEWWFDKLKAEHLRAERA